MVKQQHLGAALSYQFPFKVMLIAGSASSPDNQRHCDMPSQREPPRFAGGNVEAAAFPALPFAIKIPF